MALTKCPDCGSDVSTEAPTCPKCGRPNTPPKKTSPIAAGCGVIILIFLVVGGISALVGGGSDDSSGSKASAAPPKPEKPINIKDATALDDKYGIPANSACTVYADDYLRQAAKYDFKWDDVGFLGVKFDRYLKVVSTPGVLTVATNKVALQNGFGAYQHVQLFCRYDTQADKVLGYSLIQQQ